MASNWVKGYFRKGKALIGLEQYGEAVDALRLALKLEKNNKEIKEALKYALIKYVNPDLFHCCPIRS